MKIKIKLFPKGVEENPREELELTIMCLFFICVSCSIVALISPVNMYFDLKDAGAKDIFVQLLPAGTTMLIMASCCIPIWLLLREVKKQQYFTRRNTSLIGIVGGLVTINGGIQGLLNSLLPNQVHDSSFLIYLLLGCFISLIACIFKLGIKMQEEQELTI